MAITKEGPDGVFNPEMKPFAYYELNARIARRPFASATGTGFIILFGFRILKFVTKGSGENKFTDFQCSGARSARREN